MAELPPDTSYVLQSAFSWLEKEKEWTEVVRLSEQFGDRGIAPHTRRACMVYPHRQGEIATTTFFKQGIETATFHILTPYPTTALYERMAQQGRLFHSNWDLYDTRHVVYRPAKLAPEALEAGYWRAYRDFYRWGSIFQGAWMKESWNDRLRHMPDAAGWKKFEPAWDLIIGRKCNVLDGNVGWLSKESRTYTSGVFATPLGVAQSRCSPTPTYSL